MTPEDNIPEEKAVPIKKPEEEVECDPLTMNCNEMPKVMETLMRKESILTEGIGRITELKKMFPSRKELDALHDDAVRAKEKIHDTISDITTRFSMCTLKEEKPEETKKEEEKVSEDSSETETSTM
jgi:hypothetical protein